MKLRAVLRLAGGPVGLVGSWACLACAITTAQGRYSPPALLALTFGALLLGGYACCGLLRASRLSGWVIAVVVLTMLRFALPPMAPYWNYWLTQPRLLVGVAAVGGLALTALCAVAQPSSPLLTGVMVAGWAAACAYGIVLRPHPDIDVFAFLQNAAHVTLHGRDLYAQCYPVRGISYHPAPCVYPYLPMTTVVQLPFFALFGDVRYAYVAAGVVASLALARLAPSGWRSVVVGLALFFPGFAFGVNQAWPEPLLFAWLALAVWGMATGRQTVAMLCLAAALATKQHVVLVLPFAAASPAFGWRRTLGSCGIAVGLVLPWTLGAPHRFLQGVLWYNLRLAPRLDSISVNTLLLRHRSTLPVAVVAAVVVLVVAALLRFGTHDTGGVALGSAVTLFTFDYLNKQSFFNEWELVLWLLVLHLAAELRRVTVPLDPSEPPAPSRSVPGTAGPRNAATTTG